MVCRPRRYRRLQFPLVTVASENTEDKEEQVDEIKIEIERTHCSEFVGQCRIKVGGGKLLHLLCVPRGKTDKYKHTHNRDDEIHSAAVEEYIYKACYDKTEKGHHEE